MTNVPPIPTSDLLPAKKPYEPRGGAKELFARRGWDGEILCSGPAGTGKTTAILNLLWWYAATYDGMRGLIIRKTRESLTESVLATWERFVVPENHPCIAGGANRAGRKSYKIGKSEIVVAGMKSSGRDMTQNVMSTDYDVIVAFESIEFTEEEWEKLTTRLRHGCMPNQLIIADTNPSFPRHWLKQRCHRGQTHIIESRHEDNPLLYDVKTGDWTPFGRKYIAKLDSLTGARKSRLRHGLWVQAEGVVYETFDAARHIVESFDIPQHWRRYWSIDFGYTNPFVCQWWAEDDDGRLWLYRELYCTGLIVEDATRQMMTAVGAYDPATGKRDWSKAREPRPQAIVCDHDAEDRATLERHLGLKTVAARKDKRLGIQAVEKRLRKAGDDRPRLFIFNNAIISRDPELEEAKKPIGFAEEIDGYVWANHLTKEEPVKENDHSCDAGRYMAMHLEPVGSGVTIPHTRMAGNNGQAAIVPVTPGMMRPNTRAAAHGVVDPTVASRHGPPSRDEMKRRLRAKMAGVGADPPAIAAIKQGQANMGLDVRGVQGQGGTQARRRAIRGNGGQGGLRRGVNGVMP